MEKIQENILYKDKYKKVNLDLVEITKELNSIREKILNIVKEKNDDKANTNR